VNGKIDDIYNTILDDAAHSDPGVFVTISFTALAKSGTSPLDLDDVIVIDYDGDPVIVDVNDGNVTVDVETIYYTLDITIEGSGTTYPLPGTYSHITGTVVGLEATPDLGWSFDHWDGDVTDPNSATTTITMDANKTVTANFTDCYTLTVSTVGNGHVNVVPDKPCYLYGEEPELTAVADPDWTFDHWSGDLSGNTNPTTVFMDGNKDVTATFKEEPSNPPTSAVDPLPQWKRIIPFSVTVTSFDDMGVVNITLWYRYSENGAEWTEWISYGIDKEKPWSWSFTGSDGYYEFYSIAIDNHENVEDPPDVADASTGIDTTPPETEIDLSGTKGKNCWWTSEVKVTLNAMDNLSGLESTWYTIDGGFWNPYVNPFKISEEGYHIIEAYSFDWAGNREKPSKIAEFKIDAKLPVTTHEFDGILGETGWFIGPVNVTLSARDAMSGVNYTMYKINGGVVWQEYLSPFVVSEDGTYTIYFYSVDLAGNKEETNNATFKIEFDKIPPVTTHTFEGVLGKNGWHVSNVVIEITAEDNAAGVDYTNYTIDGDEWTKRQHTGPFTVIVPEDGNYILSYYSVDKVKNNERVNGPFDLNIDKTSPTIVLDAEGSGSIWLLKADVSDETSGIAKVEFYANGEYLGDDTESPYEWECTGVREGDIAQAIAYDKAGNLKISNKKAGQSQDPDFIGYTFLIGLISNVEEAENIITAQAIRLRYIEIAPTGINKGFVKMTAVEFSNHNLVGRTLRSFGQMSLVIGIFKGGITIEGE